MFFETRRPHGKSGRARRAGPPPRSRRSHPPIAMTAHVVPSHAFELFVAASVSVPSSVIPPYAAPPRLVPDTIEQRPMRRELRRE
jgi:hypothetical protein